MSIDSGRVAGINLASIEEFQLAELVLEAATLMEWWITDRPYPDHDEYRERLQAFIDKARQDGV